MKHINITNWQGNITDWTKFNYIYGGLDETIADRVNLRIPGTNLRNYFRKSNNLVNNSTDVFELGGVSYLPGKSYQEAKDTASPSVANKRLRSKNLINVDPNKTYTLSVPSPYLIIAQGYNNNLGVDAAGTDFNKAQSVVTFTGVNQVAIIARYEDGRKFSSVNDIKNINIMFTEGTSTTYEPYDSMVMVENVDSNLQPLDPPKITVFNQVDLGKLNWSGGQVGWYQTYFPQIQVPANNVSKANLSAPGYKSMSSNDVFSPTLGDMGIGVNVNNHYLQLRNNATSSIAEIKVLLKGVIMLYEPASQPSSNTNMLGMVKPSDPAPTAIEDSMSLDELLEPANEER